MGFAQWLSEQFGLLISLPTGWQWQRTASGDDELLYPWGHDFDPDCCNTRENKIRMTTLVTRYPEGASPVGVFDMAGNTWEWCVNSDEQMSPDEVDITTDDKRIIHGGSFISGKERAQTRFRFQLNPEFLYGSIGFRIVSEKI